MAAALYELIMTAVLALSAMSSFCFLSGMEEVRTEYYLCTALIDLVLVLARKLKTRGRLILAGVCISVIAGIVLSVPQEGRIGFLLEHRWVFWVLAGSIACALLEWNAQSHRWLRAIPAAAGIGVLILFVVRGIQNGKSAVLFILLYHLILLAETVQRSWKKEGQTNAQAHIAFAFPFLALPVLVVSLFTMPAEPYQWKHIRSLMENVRSQYEVLRQTLNLKRNWDHSEAEVGFTDEVEFFGNLNESSYEALRIHTIGVRPGTGIYLSGRSFDSFNGRSWQKTDTSEDNYRMYDLIETLSAIITYDGDSLRDYVRTSGLEIDCKGIRTEHVFMPAKTMPQIRNHETMQEGGDLWFTGRNTDEYAIDYCRLNRRYEKLEDLLNHPSIEFPSEEVIEDAAKVLQGLDVSEYTPQSFTAYRNRIRDIYCPKTELSAEMRSWLDDVLEGASTDYEKLVAIEKVLSRLTYTSSPGELPETVTSPAEFLDYLIFESKQGYCTHFATAFVLLARAEGIPARYQQGYCFSAGEEETKVLSTHAHAWAEAYIEGIGWLDFEPSPGFKRYAGWKVTARSDSTNNNVTALVEEEEEEEETEATADTVAELQETRSSRRTYLPLLLAGLFLIAYIPLDILIRRLRYQKMSSREKIRILFRRCMRILRRMGYRPGPGETLQEYRTRVNRDIPDVYLRFIHVYEEILYGERDVSDQDIKVFDTAVYDLRQLFVQKLTKRRNRSEF